MSSFDNSQQNTSGLQLPGLVTQLSPTEQLPFPETNPMFAQNGVPGPATPAPDMYTLQSVAQPIYSTNSFAGTTRQLTFNASPAVTRILPDVQTGTLPTVSTTTALRQPVVIRATGKKSPGTMRPPRGRSWVVSSLA